MADSRCGNPRSAVANAAIFTYRRASLLKSVRLALGALAVAGPCLMIASPGAGAQESGPGEIPVTGSRDFIVPLAGSPARVVTDLGPQPSLLRGQLVFRQTRDASGAVLTTLRDFNLLGTSVPTRRGPTGPHSLSLRGSSMPSVAVDPANGRVSSAVTLFGHYQLIDKIVGTRQLSKDQQAPFSETFGGELRGRLSDTQPAPGTPAIFTGGIRLQLGGTVVGAIRELEILILPTPIEWLPPPCEGAFGFRTLAIQPIFVRTGPDDVRPTGRSLDTLMEHAEAIWNKACVTFIVRRPLYINNGDLKILDENNEDAELRPARAGAPDAVEVYFVESMPSLGGVPLTAGSGTESAHVIISDDTISMDPPSLNALAHELGHAMNLCHPGAGVDGCTVSDDVVLVEGSPGTVMEPSGVEADNPDLQSLDNCRNIASPLFVWRRLYCCLTTDCDSDCRPPE